MKRRRICFTIIPWVLIEGAFTQQTTAIMVKSCGADPTTLVINSPRRCGWIFNVGHTNLSTLRASLHYGGVMKKMAFLNCDWSKMQLLTSGCLH